MSRPHRGPNDRPERPAETEPLSSPVETPDPPAPEQVEPLTENDEKPDESGAEAKDNGND